MQTFLYVLGPFLLQGGVGLAAVIAAYGAVRHWLVPRGRLMRAQRIEIEQQIQYASEANGLVTDLVVETARNRLLEDHMPNSLIGRLHDLNREPTKRKELA